MLFIIISFTAVTTLQANEPTVETVNNNFNVFPEDSLAQAVYEVGFINGVLRSIPADTSLNADIIIDLKTKAQQASSLMNYVCAQVYVNHLKDLRDSNNSDQENHYNKNSLLVTASLLSTVIQGGQRGAKLMIATDKLGQDEAISQCYNYINHLKPFLCSEFECSYRKLFDLEDLSPEDIQNPYYTFFCSALSDKSNSKKDL